MQLRKSYQPFQGMLLALAQNAVTIRDAALLLCLTISSLLIFCAYDTG